MSNPDHDQIQVIAGLDLDKRRDVQIIQRCVSLCSLFNISGDDLVNSWLAYAFNNRIDDDISISHLDALERYLHKENQKKLAKETLRTPNKSSTLLLRQKNVVSPVAVSQTQLLTSSFSTQLDAVLSVTAKPNITSPPPIAKPAQASKTFMSPSIFASPAAPSESYAQRTNRGRTVQSLNLELNDFRPVSREDRENLQIEFNLESWESKFRYMFQPRELINRLRQEREDAFLESICSTQLAGSTIDDLCPLDVASASEVICGGSIWTYNTNNKLHITDTWLRRGTERVLLTLPTDDKAQWGFFPGMVCVIRGFNPTGNNLLVKEVYVPKLLSSPSPMVTDNMPSEISIMFASGPFTFENDLVFSPLCDLLEEVRKRAPTLLILSGPFVDLDNNASTDKFPAQVRDDLWSEISQKLQDVETRVFTVPHLRESQHVACFPEPPFCFRSSSPQNMDSKIVHLPNPSVFTVNGVKLCVMSHDIVFHLAGNEVSKASMGAQANRVSRLCSYLLHQRSLYPLTAPPPGASIDWTHMKKYNLEAPIPDLFFLPSQLGQYARTAGNSLFVNSGQLVKGKNSSGTYARVVIHSGVTPIQERTRIEIVRI